MAGHAGRDGDYLSDINVTPLVDVMLVLLIVMMVAASFAVTQSLKVNLPSADSGSAESAPLMLNVDSDGDWTLEGEALSRETLRAALQRATAGAERPHVIIAADGAVAHHHVVAAMDFLRTERVERISIGVARAATKAP